MGTLSMVLDFEKMKSIVTEELKVVESWYASTDNRDYYGVLIDIIELHYIGGNKIAMFKCDWRDVDHCCRGIMVDKFGQTLVNVTRSLKSNEPFVLACQAEQVFYVVICCYLTLFC